MSEEQKEFYDLAEFPMFSSFTENWQIIRDEALALDTTVFDIDRVNKSHEQVFEELKAIGRLGWLKGWDTEERPNDKWLTYPIYFYDKMIFNISETMPRTSRMLEQLSGIRVCALNKMLPDLFLGTHEHPDHKKRRTLLYHLCLSMEETGTPYNYLNVNGNFVQQLPGKAYIFDGSYPHFALNASSQNRIIMYIEFYRDNIGIK